MVVKLAGLDILSKCRLRVVLSHMVVKLEFRSRLSRARLRVVLSHMVVKHNRNAAEKLEV